MASIRRVIKPRNAIDMGDTEWLFVGNGTNTTSRNVSSISNERQAWVTLGGAFAPMVGSLVHITGSTPSTYNGYYKVLDLITGSNMVRLDFDTRELAAYSSGGTMDTLCVATIDGKAPSVIVGDTTPFSSSGGFDCSDGTGYTPVDLTGLNVEGAFTDGAEVVDVVISATVSVTNIATGDNYVFSMGRNTTGAGDAGGMFSLQLSTPNGLVRASYRAGSVSDGQSATVVNFSAGNIMQASTTNTIAAHYRFTPSGQADIGIILVNGATKSTAALTAMSGNLRRPSYNSGAGAQLCARLNSGAYASIMGSAGAGMAAIVKNIFVAQYIDKDFEYVTNKINNLYQRPGVRP